MGIPTSIENLTHEVLTLDPDELWLAEADRRDAEMESGEIEGIPSEEIFTWIESQYAD